MGVIVFLQDSDTKEADQFYFLKKGGQSQFFIYFYYLEF